MIGGIEVFCEYPATCPPNISIGKHTETKAPAGSMRSLSVLFPSSKYNTKNSQFVEHGKVRPDRSKEWFLQIYPGKGYSNLPAGVDTRSSVKEVGCSFIWIQNNHGCAQSVDVNNIGLCITCQMSSVQRINHTLYSCPQFAYVAHSSVLGIERRFPIRGSFVGPGGRCRLWRWPFIQYTTKTVRVPRMKASWGSAICGKCWK